MSFTKQVTWGEMKKAAIKQNIPGETEIVMFDEPFNGLNGLTWSRFKSFLEEQNTPDDIPILEFDYPYYRQENYIEFVFLKSEQIKKISPAKRFLTKHFKKIFLRHIWPQLPKLFPSL